MPCSETEKSVDSLLRELARESKYSPTLSHLLASDDDQEHISATQRDKCLQHLLKLNLHFGFEPETFALAVNYTDRFLSKVKANNKYLQCIGLASLYVAAKMSEEEEFVPLATDFVNVSRAQCTASDLLRMESLILQKLEWDMFVPTSVLFLQKFCDLLQLLGSLSNEFATTIVQHILPKIMRLLCQTVFSEHKGSTLALALLQFEISPLSASLSLAIDDIIKALQLNLGDVLHCLGLIQDFMDQQVMCRANKLKSRKRRKRSLSNSLHILPTIYESTDGQDAESNEITDDVFEDHPCEQMEDANNNQSIEVYHDNEHWLENKQEFPDLFETLPTPIRRTRKAGKKKLHNLAQHCGSERPLYSTVLKTTCNSCVNGCREHALPLQTYAY